jgi:hypothetical protein
VNHVGAALALKLWPRFFCVMAKLNVVPGALKIDVLIALLLLQLSSSWSVVWTEHKMWNNQRPSFLQLA